MTVPRVPAPQVADFVTALFAAAGLSRAAAARVAAALIEADLSGRASHGILQADGYLARLVAGTMSTLEAPVPVSDSGAVVVLDAAEMEGHLAAEEAMKIAIARARQHGLAAVSVRRGFHFGVAGRYARMAAEAGCVGIAMCNTKAVMPAPGGAEKLVGTNPLAIALPVSGEAPVVFDMATTAGTIGRIRVALAAGEPIPEGWALDAEGNPTTEAEAALGGLLLPAGGAKGFGLAFMIDLLSGLLASGGWGPTLGQIGGDLTKPYNASYLFIALDIAHFRSLDGFLDEARAAVDRLRGARKAAGTARLFTPGEQSAEALATSGGLVALSPAVGQTLAARAKALGVPLPGFLSA